MEDLFSSSNENKERFQPLAERARPQTLEEFLGQQESVGAGKSIRKLFEQDRLPSLILWGPPGTGKTSFALLVAKKTKAQFVSLSAVDTGAKELRQEGERARDRLQQFGERTIVFIDEIHRLNKSQQDVLLPYVEKGFITLIGATTENPSFELNSALLSRTRVVLFKQLDESALSKILDRGLWLLTHEEGKKNSSFSQDAVEKIWSSLTTAEAQAHFSLKSKIAEVAGGDARQALNLLQIVYEVYSVNGFQPLTENQVLDALSRRHFLYDKARDQHYDTISAFIKSIRGSDPHAAIYYLARMLKGGEDPLFIARRLVILASEDISNADPRALLLAVATKDAVDFVGMPEAQISLAQCVAYLATAPKSNRSYMALLDAQALIDKTGPLPVPLHIRNPQTKLMEELGYGRDYQYSHEGFGGWTDQQFLPDELRGKELYKPTSRGYEKQISNYLEWIKNRRGDTLGNPAVKDPNKQQSEKLENPE